MFILVNLHYHSLSKMHAMLLILFFQADKVLVGTMAVLGGVVAAGVAAELCARKTNN